MSDVKLSQLDKEHALKEWHVLEGMLAKALMHGRMGTRYGTDEMRKWVEEETAIILIAWEPEHSVMHAAFLCSLEQHPKCRVFQFLAAGGSNIEVWGHVWPAFRAFARGLGADQIEVRGRRGWEKFITAREAATVFIEEL